MTCVHQGLESGTGKGVSPVYREEADHFDEGDGRDADFFKVMRVLFPGSRVELGFLSILVVLVELVGLFHARWVG